MLRPAVKGRTNTQSDITMSPTTPKQAAPAPAVVSPSASTIQVEIASLVAQVKATSKGASIMASKAPSVGIYAFTERTGPKGGVKPIGVGAGLNIPGKKPIYFYTEASVMAALSLLGAPKDTPVAKSLLGAARAVEAFTKASKPAKKEAASVSKADF